MNKVNVELHGESSIEGLESVLGMWRTQFPSGKLIGATGYGRLVLTLEMPPATEVIPPQITDGRVMEAEHAPL